MDLKNLPDINEFKRLVFGVSACPFLTHDFSQDHAEKNKIIISRAAETVLKSTYMDNCMDPIMNQDKAV